MNGRKCQLALAIAVTFVSAATSLIAVYRAGIPLRELAAYSDGHLYIEIAKSFPLPLAPAAKLYAGHAPGYPAAVALVHLLGPGWGLSALLTTWLASGLCAALFWSLCEELGLAAFWPTLMFAFSYPYWRVVTAGAQAEPLAMALVLAAALACVCQQPGLTVLGLASASLTRFPAAIVAPAFAWRFAASGRLKAAAMTLVVPMLTLLVWNSYVAHRVAGVSGFVDAHRTWLGTSVGLPFLPFLQENPASHVFSYTILVATFVVFAISTQLVGVQAWLVLWFAGVMIFHAMLNGTNEVWRYILVDEFSRLTLLAWPAAVLLVAMFVRGRSRRSLRIGAGIALAVFSQIFAVRTLELIMRVQPSMSRSLGTEIEHLDDEEPSWLLVR